MPTLCLIALTLAGALLPRATQAMALVQDGASEYAIVLADDAIAPEQTAARELQSYLQQVTGALLPVLSEAQVAGADKRIVVGPCETFTRANPDVDLAALKHDGIVMRLRGDTIYLAGGRPRGTLYAVYTFLEDVVGVRWWSSTESEVPARPTIEVGDLDTIYVPRLQCREAFYRDALEGIYAARSKCNGHYDGVPPEYGGHYTLLGWCHTFGELIPPARYFADHPEWFSLINGRRTDQATQLCLTNDEMRAELVRNALGWIRGNPAAGMISISQNDWQGACQCDKCQAVVEEEGSQSGPVIRFVNAVAEEIEKQYPDFLVETLAYSYTRTPPKHVQPRRNVVVRLCCSGCSKAHPLATGDQNAAFRADMEAWSAISPQLYIWNYITNFDDYIQPFPNLHILAPDIRYFIQNKAIGLFEQGDSECSCSDFPELRAWLIAKLMWNPSLDEKALVREFMEGYYGPAAQPLLDYIALIEGAVHRSGEPRGWYIGDTSTWMRLEDLNRAGELFAQAAEAVRDDQALARRVRRARMPLDHTWIRRHRDLKRAAAMVGTPYLGPAVAESFCESFIQAAHEFDARSYAEGRSFEDLVPRLREACAPPGQSATAPAEVAGLAANEWVDIQEGEFRLYYPGDWVTLVDDPSASNGRAARMRSSHGYWATQYALPGDLGDLGSWHCYAVARCEARANVGTAMQLGLYDNSAPGDLASLRPGLELAGDGQYHTYDLGVHDLRVGMYFWVAPAENPDQVDAVYVDRFFMVREK